MPKGIPKPRLSISRRLTTKEKKLLAGLKQGKTVAAAARDAGYSQKHPRQAGHIAMKAIEQKAPDLFARHGLDDDSFLDKCILPALSATETRTVFSRNRWRYSRPLPDAAARNTANALVARMKGMIREQAPEATIGVKVLVVNAAHRPPARISGNGHAPVELPPNSLDTSV